MRRYGCLLFLALAAAGGASAQSGHQYKLDWSVPGEELIYRSCGCADSCWVAEVRSIRKKTVKAKLRCDCEKLYFSSASDAERVVSESCDAFNEDGKMDRIAPRIKELQSRRANKP